MKDILTATKLNAMFLQLEEEREKRAILLTEIQESFTQLQSRLSQANKALEFAEYMAKSGECLLNAINNVAVADSAFDDNMCDETEAALDHAVEVRSEAWTGLQRDIYEFRKRVPA